MRFLKAWNDFREIKRNNLKFPSGFVLTILAGNNFVSDDNQDIAFLETLQKIQSSLNYRFECIRPITPKGENVFEDFSETRVNDFVNALNSLVSDLGKAKDKK